MQKKKKGLNVASLEEKTVDNFTADFTSDYSIGDAFGFDAFTGLDASIGDLSGLESFGLDNGSNMAGGAGSIGQAMFRLNLDGDAEFLGEDYNDGVDD